MSQAIDPIQLLPTHTMRRLARTIGLASTLRLLEAHGGTKFTLPTPRNTRARRSLAKLIGPDEAEAFYREFAKGAKDISLPKLDKINNLVRDRCIQAELAAGQSVKVTARKYRLTTRYVTIIGGRSLTPIADPVQGDLFGSGL